MRFPAILRYIIFALLLSAAGCAAPTTQAIDWSAHFGDREEAFALLNLNTNDLWRHNPDLCAKRYSPCSTFKVVNALIALETGVATDGEMVIAWDGVEQSRPALNRDHTLRSAIADSVLWYFQEIAQRIGIERMQHFINEIGYGNADLSTGIAAFWLNGSLAISADEQVDLLARLERSELPFSARSRSIVRDALIVQQTDRFILRGKSGSCDSPGDDDHGWFIGIVEADQETWAFACLIVGSRAWGFSEARAIAESILTDRGLIDDGVECHSSRR